MTPGQPWSPVEQTAGQAAANLLHPRVPHRHFRTPGDLRWLSRLVGVLVITGLLAAYLVTVDKLVSATGYLETDARLFTVRTPLDGRTADIAVGEDDRVIAGQRLLTLDTTNALLRVRQQKAVIERIVHNHYRLAARLQALYAADSDPAPITPLPGTRAPEHAGVYRRQISDEQRVRTLELRDRETQLTAARAQRSALTARVRLSEAQFRQTGRLVKSGARSESQRRSARAEWLALREKQTRQDSAITRLENAVASQRANLAAWRSSTEAEHLDQLARLASDFTEARAELNRRQNNLTDHTVRAPANGIISSLDTRGAGEWMARGDPLLQLRPEFQLDDLYLEIRIPARDAVWVEPGMTFRAVSAGSPAEDHGIVHGRIEWLAVDTESKNDEAGTYRAHGRVERIEKGSSGQAPRLDRPGLQLRVSIRTGQRRLLNYLIDPFAEHLGTAWTEPS